MKRYILCLTISSLLFSACNPTFYSPDTQNVPLISQKGETNLTVAGNGNQVEFQGAYGFGKVLSVKANGSFFIPADLDNGDGGSGRYFEAGLGYFKPLVGNFVFETYGIVGFGRMENHFPSAVSGNPGTSGDISASVFRYGLQPNFGYKTKHFTAALSARLVNLVYSDIEGDLVYLSRNQADYLNSNKSNFLVEPAITIRGGLEKIKLQVQYGYSHNMSNKNFSQDDNFLTVGLNFNLK
jgi:hypothetical protein